METFAQRLKRLRSISNLTSTQVAMELGISPSTYREWEYGRQITGLPYAKLAQVFNVSLSHLLTGEENQAKISELENIELILSDALNRVKSIKQNL